MKFIKGSDLRKTKQWKKYVGVNEDGTPAKYITPATKAKGRQQSCVIFLNGVYDQVLEAFFELIDKGIYHEDAKLENVLFDNGQVNVIDFGQWRKPRPGTPIEVLKGRMRNAVLYSLQTQIPIYNEVSDMDEVKGVCDHEYGAPYPDPRGDGWISGDNDPLPKIAQFSK